MAKEYIDREAAANVFSRARSTMRPEDYRTFDEMNTRDLMLLNAEQAIRLLPAADVVEVVRCGECDWWTKQEASCQGRCARYGFYPTAAWYCTAGAKMDKEGEK